MVNLINISIKHLMNIAKNRRLFLFGASKRLLSYKNNFPTYNLSSITDFIVDNDILKLGSKIQLDDKLFEINDVRYMIDNIKKTDIILIMSVHYSDIVKQLDEINELDNIDCCILDYIFFYNEGYTDMCMFNEYKDSQYFIPSVIHYCWFGKKNMPEEYKKYINSWKIKCPEYKIVRWDESNYDVRKNEYVSKAYDDGKWAFVSDYARLDIIYNYGGIYLDTDVELIKNLNELRKFHSFFGFESEIYIGTGLGFGAEKKNIMVGELLRTYDKLEPGTYIPCTQIQTDDMVKKGLARNNTFQFLKYGNAVILPTEFLCPMDYKYRNLNIDEKTYSIHHYSASWIDGNNINEYDEISKRMFQNSKNNG